jgi:hypothetical protein
MPKQQQFRERHLAFQNRKVFQTMPTIKTVTNYRAELIFDDETICSLTSSRLDGVQDKIRKLLPAGQKVRFEPVVGQDESQGTLAIFHDSHSNGNQPLGWIVAYEVPTNMSVKNVTEARLRQAA